MAGTHSESRLGIALVGAGYWGSRLARNLADAPGASVVWVCDLVSDHATKLAGPLGARPTTSLAEVLDDPAVAAVVVATPASTHAAIVRAGLDADRHLLVEKPLAKSVADARTLADLAQTRGLTVMCDHTYRFAPAVQRVRELMTADAIGSLHSAASVRTNRNHGQPDVDVFWDLAHHDLSLLTYVLPAPAQPVAISARSADRLGVGRAHAGDLILHLANGAVARVHVDWDAPHKARTVAFTGDAGTLTWDDLAPEGPLIELAARGTTDRFSVDEDEPLALVVREFVSALTEGRAASCGPTEEIAVLSLLEAATQSAAHDGARVTVALREVDSIATQP